MKKADILCKAIIEQIGCDSYLQGAGGKNYQEKELFCEHNIKLLDQSYSCPTYNQGYDSFVKGNSILDSLLCVGFEKTKELVRL